MMMRKPSRQAKATPSSSAAAASLDVVFACDMATSGHAALRAATEAAAAAAAGYGVGLFHLPPPGTAALIAPEMQRVAGLPGVAILDPDTQVSARLLVLHLPASANDAIKRTARITARQTVIVAEAAVDATAPAVVARASSACGARLSPDLKTEREPWPIVLPDVLPVPETAPRQPLRLGIIGTVAASQSFDRLATEATARGAEIIVWTERGLADDLPVPSDWTVLDGDETSLDWFMRKTDALVVCEADTERSLIAVTVAAALGAGKPVLLPLAQKQRFGTAALYGTPDTAVAVLCDLAADATAWKRQARRAAAFAARSFSAERYLKRLARYAGAPRRGSRKTATVARRATPRVLFLSKGGVGLGHVARTLAVSRHARSSYEPVFVTMAESAGLIESFGYRAEYIPSAAYADATAEDWSPWFQSELEGLIEDYGAEAVVFDGSDPSEALVDAVASRGRCKLAWIRRGMWEPGYDPALHLSPAFDLIIEPGELAATRDRGATALRRQEAHHVAPITLLDRADLLSREKAAAALGLDPARPAVLLQLGSGENRDILGTLDHVITLLKDDPDVQIALAEWTNTPGTLKLWRGIKLLKGAPLSLYYNAFDFSISAAGYNTFHEVIGFRLPTIFMPNTAPGMDDQSARAQFAQEKGAAIELQQTEFGELPQILDLMMKPGFRDVMRENCDALYSGNGASAASARIAELVN